MDEGGCSKTGITCGHQRYFTSSEYPFNASMGAKSSSIACRFDDCLLFSLSMLIARRCWSEASYEADSNPSSRQTLQCITSNVHMRKHKYNVDVRRLRSTAHCINGNGRLNHEKATLHLCSDITGMPQGASAPSLSYVGVMDESIRVLYFLYMYSCMYNTII
jgi:hypothetical protein